MTQVKFPSIEQFRSVIHNVNARAGYDGLDEEGKPKYKSVFTKPVLPFRGYVKLHGTNAGIVFDGNSDDITYQSKERVLTLQEDNAGFMLYWAGRTPILQLLRMHVMEVLVRQLYTTFEGAKDATIAVFGEWCGSNIQPNVAIADLAKMFVIFAVRVKYKEDEPFWLPIDQVDFKDDHAKIYTISQFPTYDIAVDFNNPLLSQNRLIELTEAVEAECPVAKHFGVSGLGEGIVWRCNEYHYNSSSFWFKVKGEKHSASKVKKLAAVDVEAIKNQVDFVAMTVTENRLMQGLQNLVHEQRKPFEITSMGDFIRWVYNDIVKEESDTMIANQIDAKKIGGLVANAARAWFIEMLNSGYEV